MSSLNVARLTNKLRSLFVLRGETFVAPEVSDEVRGVVVLEGERPEHFFLGDERLWSIRALSLVPLVGQFARLQFSLATDSGLLMIVETIRPANIGLIVSIADGGVVGGEQANAFTRRDGRIASTDRPGIRVGSNGVAAIGPEAHLLLQSNLNPIPWVISPGTALLITSTFPDTDFDVTLTFRVRALEKSESA